MNRAGSVLLAGVVVAVLGLTGCAQKANLEAAKAAIMDADTQFSKVTGDKRLEGFASFLAEDVTTIRADQPVVQGKQAMAERWSRLLNDPAMAIEWKPQVARVASSGDFGYTIGSYRVTRSDAQGQRVVSTGKYVTIWQKQADGSWKVVHDSGVADTSPQTAPKQ
jgi:ketosteroid isomerase-like protein